MSTTPNDHQLNINDQVRVKLNARGSAIYRAHEQRLLEAAPELIEHLPGPDADGYTGFTLWKFMQVFGPHMGNGLELPFEMDVYTRPHPHR